MQPMSSHKPQHKIQHASLTTLISPLKENTLLETETSLPILLRHYLATYQLTQ